MSTGVVYDGVGKAGGGSDSLFAGQKLFFARSVPQRSWLVENAKANGADVVSQEADADILLVDHAKRPAAPGTHSYRYVELSIRNGKLEDVANHEVGVNNRVNRVVGSVTIAPKGGRNPYTDADDQLLWDWVKPYENAGEKTAGNVIYQQLEAVNPRHTFQSWRDRWLKYTRYQDRQIKNTNMHDQSVGGVPSQTQRETHHTQSEAARRVVTQLEAREPLERRDVRWQSEQPSPRRRPSTAVFQDRPDGEPVSSTTTPFSPEPSQGSSRPFSGANSSFTRAEGRLLLDAASTILAAPEETLSNAWHEMAEVHNAHSAAEWRHFFESEVSPYYHLKAAKTKARSSVKGEQDLSPEPQTGRDESRTPNSSVRARLLQNMDKGVQTSPLSASDDESATPTKRSPRLRSPEFRPESPTTGRLPEPNEARKRSASKSTKSGTNSQESVQATNGSVPVMDDPSDDEEAEADREAQHQPWSSPFKRKRDDDDGDGDEGTPLSPSLPSIEDLFQSQRSKRTKRTHFNDKTEIPSTPPENLIAVVREEIEITEIIEDESFDVTLPVLRPLRDSLTPSIRRSLTPRRSPWRTRATESPLIVPEDSRVKVNEAEMRKATVTDLLDSENDEDVFNTPVNAATDWARPHSVAGGEDSRTSPLWIKLVSDHDSPATSSFTLSQPHAEDSSGDEDDKTPELETAPDSGLAEVWETAPEAADAAGIGGEVTIPESNNTHLLGFEQRKIDTQTLFQRDLDVADEDLDAFALPEPEGGWDEKDEQALAQRDRRSEVDEQEHAGPDSGLNLPQPSKSRSSATGHVPEPIQPSPEEIDAYIDKQLEENGNINEGYLLHAIDVTCFDIALMARVYMHLVEAKGVPADIAGVWTEEDDAVLEGSDARQLASLEKKHGARGVQKRWDWREGQRSDVE